MASALRAYATFIQRHNSGMVGRFPYERMPTRKTFAVAQKKTKMVTSETTIDTAMCQIGGSDATVRANIVTGPKTGISENATAICESGLVMIGIMTNHGIIITNWMGAIICCASLSVLHAAPAMA